MMWANTSGKDSCARVFYGPTSPPDVRITADVVAVYLFILTNKTNRNLKQCASYISNFELGT